MVCPKCGSRVARVHRALFHKLLYSQRFKCLECEARTGRLRRVFADQLSTLRFVFSKWTRCPRCESYGVYRLNQPDRIDSFTSNPVALVQVIVGAPKNKCPLCRLHYYDWRKPKPKSLVRHDGGVSPSPHERSPDTPSEDSTSAHQIPVNFSDTERSRGSAERRSSQRHH